MSERTAVYCHVQPLCLSPLRGTEVSRQASAGMWYSSAVLSSLVVTGLNRPHACTKVALGHSRGD